MPIVVKDYRLSSPLQGAAWVVHAYYYPGRCGRVAILTAEQAWFLFQGGQSPYRGGTIVECRSLRNAHRVARRLRKEYGACDTHGPRRWHNAAEYAREVEAAEVRHLEELARRRAVIQAEDISPDDWEEEG